MPNQANTAIATPVSVSGFFKDTALVVSATVFMALCAHVTVPLLFSPVPLSLQNFGVLLIGLVLGRNRATAALSLYLLEGAAGLPVFAPMGPGGVAQLLGPTGGFLLAYPVVAYVTGAIFDRMGKTMRAALVACFAAECVLFVSGISWFRATVANNFVAAIQLAFLPFIPGEILKVVAASSIGSTWQRFRRNR
jgi:biotin transport system substrate-specific component